MRTALTIDRYSPVPLSRQIYEFWRGGILDGRFAGGDRVSSTRDVAAALNLSRGTVTQAYDQLVSEGYLETTKGSGTFVCRQLPEQLLHVPAGARRGNMGIAAPRLSAFGKRLKADFAALERYPGCIYLSHWGPDLTLFPLEIWRRLCARSLRDLGPEALDYAHYPQSHAPLCDEIAKYAARVRGVSCAADQVIVVNGSQQGLELCARLLIEPGDEAAVENPGYLGARRIFEACGARLRPVPVDRDGMIIARIGGTPRLAYVTPAHQFPTGVALSLARRLELIAWARRHGATIIEDDYDSEYRYGGAPTPALQGLATEVPVIYCGTFSKVMFPGLRVGYLIVPRSLAAVFARAKWLSDRQSSVHQQAALYRFMQEGHLERHVRRMRRVYGLRRTALAESLQHHFGDGAAVFGEAAGMHAYVRFTDPGVAVRAQRNKVQLRSATAYYHGRAPLSDYLMGFSMLSERSIREGIKRLAA